ncbi:MAG TPA: flagellar basal body rod C-terminal domain-containing protein, partial [Nocardioidaceae bacterium]|nr:flagellar basal body rod C-terminal domain-containing protein [Nocardioidaceae bacterium]
RKWLDAVSDNISNINTASRTSEDAFKERMVSVQAVEYGQGDGGVQVAGVSFGSGEGRVVYEPDNPLADENGNVKYPDIDLGDQMAELMMAQRGYQANATVIDRATDAYKAALALGKG